MVEQLQQKIANIVNKFVITDQDLKDLIKYYEEIKKKKIIEKMRERLERIKIVLKGMVGRVLVFLGVADNEDVRNHTSTIHILASVRVNVENKENAIFLKGMLQ